ncbi:MAG TPA: hypothetical protein VE684_05295 [Crenalkalicoccus sp.]|jgi:probable HAF family extracellular repeat protein|nr:hypothetical protein [Crenalkalicoccus sp.]
MFTEEPSYTFTTIDVPGATSEPQLWGINDRGDIVGSYFGGGSLGEHGFLLDREGHVTTIDVPGASLTEAKGVNNRGDIVGSYLVETDGQVSTHGFLYHHGQITTLDVPGARETELNGINDFGQIVGFSPNVGDGEPLLSGGFLYDHGQFTSITAPGPISFTVPHGINDLGEIVGSVGGHGFIDKHGEFTTIDFPGATFGTEAFGINNLGQVVGEALIERGVIEGFLYDHGQFTTINYPNPMGPPETILRGINDFGEIVGNSITFSARAAFLATPNLDDVITSALERGAGAIEDVLDALADHFLGAQNQSV